MSSHSTGQHYTSGQSKRSMEDKAAANAFWVCSGCGAAHERTLPEECEGCGATALEFEYSASLNTESRFK